MIQANLNGGREISTPVVKIPLAVVRNFFVFLSAIFLLGYLSSFQPVAAQSYAVSTADDLNSAVTSISAGAVPATIQFNANPIDLAALTASSLGTLQYDTLLSGSVSLTNSILGDNANLDSTALLEIGAGDTFSLVGGGTFGQDTNGNGYAGNAANLTTGSLTTDSGVTLNVVGGTGDDSVTDISAKGGNGGNGTLSASGGASVDSSELNVYGGTGGGSDRGNGGNGGNASFTLGQDLNLTSSNSTGFIDLQGGKGGDNNDDAPGVGGNGGNANFSVAGAVSMDSGHMEVEGGTGQSGYGVLGATEGAGGGAWASIGGVLNLTSENYYNGNNKGQESEIDIEGGAGASDYNLGNSGSGGNANFSVTGPVSVDSSEFYVDGGEGGESYGGNGGDGGNATLSLGNDLTLTSNYKYADLEVDGGEGGYNDDYAPGVSGKGGDATLSVAGAVSMDSGYMEVGGGEGDYGYGLSGTTEGAGGNATASIGGALNLTSENYYNGTGKGEESEIDIYGGAGAYDYYDYGFGNGGNGGNATLSAAGPVSVDSSELYVEGGAGNYSYNANGGDGGSATLSLGNDLTLTSNYEYADLEVEGGESGENDFEYAPGFSGKGGDATLSVAGAVSMDSGYLEVGAGDGAYGYGFSGTTNGAGGNATASIGGALNLTSENYYNGNNNGQESEIDIYGGDGGYGDEDYGFSNGGKGGNAAFSVTGPVSVDSSELYVSGGDGGDAYDANGGDGGNATLSLGNDLTLTSNYEYNDLKVDGGAGGYSYSDDYAPGVSGKGGDATLSVAGAVSMDSGYMEVGGGDGDYGYGLSGTTEGAGGNATASIGGALNLTSESFYNGNNNDQESEIDIYGGEGAYDYYDYGFGNGGNGGNATLSVAGPVSVDSSELYVEGGAGNYSYNANGGDGGSATLSLGNDLTLTSNYEYADLEVTGGDGSYNDDYYEKALGGKGGDATLSVAGAVSMDSGYLEVEGGDGDYGYGAVGTTEGAGGNASVTFGGALNLTSENYYNGNNNGEESEIDIKGGAGGDDSEYANGGKGGDATLLVADAVSIDSSELYVEAADGGYSYYGNGGVGGNGLLSIGNNLTLTSNYEYADLEVDGGDGEYNDDYYGVGVKGGDATLSVAGAVSMDSAYLDVAAGDGGYGYGPLGTTEGFGGTASATMTELTVTNSQGYGSSSFNLSGGSGGEDYDYANGGNGGDATLAVSGAVSVDASTLNVTAGDAGSSTRYNGGNGGNGSITAASASLNDAAAITIQGGSGASGGVTNGNGGNATFSVNSLDLADSASGLYLNGGASGGSGAVSGTAVANIGALTGAGDVDLTGGAGSALKASSGDFTGIIEGNAALDKTGAGALTLTGANTYTGGTTVDGGTLDVVSGALSTGDVSVNSGTLVGDGGPLTINVGGNYAQGAGGTLQLGLASTIVGQWDTLNVAGTASVGGMLNLTSYGGFQPSKGQTFDMVDSAGALSGQFTAVSDTFFMPVSAIYGANNVTVQMMSFSDFGSTPNQKTVASVLDSFTGKSTDGALSDLVTSVPISDLPALYDEVSPVGLAPVYQIGFSTAQAEAGLIGQRLDAIFGLSSSGSGDEAMLNGESPMFASTLSGAEEEEIAADASPKNQFGVFAVGNGNFGTVTGDSSASGYKYTTTGITAGLDTGLAPHVKGGILVGYNTSNTTQSKSANVTVSGGQVGLYAGWREGGLHAEALADGGLNSYNTQRAIGSSVATGSTQGLQYGGQLGAGYDVKLGDTQWGPFVSGQYTYVQVDSYQEQGSPAALSIPSQGQGSFLSDLGMKASTSLKLGDTTTLSPNLSLAWEHLYQGNLTSINASLDGSSFAVNSAALGTDGVAVGAGVDVQFARTLTAFAQYQGKLGITNYDSQSFSGGVKIGF